MNRVGDARQDASVVAPRDESAVFHLLEAGVA
jgi:hypothetical protein